MPFGWTFAMMALAGSPSLAMFAPYISHGVIEETLIDTVERELALAACIAWGNMQPHGSPMHAVAMGLSTFCDEAAGAGGDDSSSESPYGGSDPGARIPPGPHL